MFKSFTCKHEYQVVTYSREWVHNGYYDYVFIYCPKCDRERKVDENTWKRIKIKQTIKKEYLEEESE